MSAHRRLAVLLLPLIALLTVRPFPAAVVLQDGISLTPTPDPFEEPPLPENATEYELGRNLYWHWCMTCHGDRGQGLTDEFRGLWDPEHQDCWGRGCHGPGDEGFLIPTVVPALVDGTRLARYGSLQELTEYIRLTHPPQSPGILNDSEYRAIALFVFALNQRPPIDPVAAETVMPSPAPAPAPARQPRSSAGLIAAVAISILLLAGIFVFVRRRAARRARAS